MPTVKDSIQDRVMEKMELRPAFKRKRSAKILEMMAAGEQDSYSDEFLNIFECERCQYVSNEKENLEHHKGMIN